MAERGIREYDAKHLLSKYLHLGLKCVLVTPKTNLNSLSKKHKWLRYKKLVVKPDQLFGKRGKHNLVLLNATFEDAKKFIKQQMGKEVKIGKATGKLTHFLIEPFVPHKKEYYVAIKSAREYDSIFFSLEGGINIEENWNKVIEIRIPILEKFNRKFVKSKLPNIENKEALVNFIEKLYNFYVDLGFTYLEINPFAFENGKIIPLDLVAKLDDTSAFENQSKWGNIEFPVPFGRTFSKEEQYIKGMDEKSGASLKLTILNPHGKIWTLVAGGGASVIYADTITDLGYGNELANYGEYSGNPSTAETYEYARTVLDLMTRDNKPGKILIIGGGIANFTDVAKTFKGIIMALHEFAPKLRKLKVKIYVRRGGPNYKEGLAQMRKLGDEIKVPIEVYGPETHMTKIVSMALRKK